MALPTRPRWPATKILEFGFKAILLRPESLGNRDASAHSECLAGHLQSRSGLAAFVLVEVDEANDAPDGRLLKSGRDNLAGWTQLHYVGLEDGVEHVVGRQGILVRLIGTQFRGGRFGDRGGGNDLALAIDPVGQTINH